MKKNNKKIINTPKTTGHKWDDIEEYNTPAPRWWLIVWAITIVWSIIYWVFFPTWPSLDGNTKGINNWTSHSELEEQELEIKERKNVYLKQFRTSTFEQILKNPKLLQFALNGGRAAFKENCAACHGTGGAGFKGFPNLNDDDWLWGGKLEDIYTTLLYGIRSGHPRARNSQMPAFGRDEILTKYDISNVISHVRSLSGLEKPNKRGRQIFIDNCAICHGKNGKGDKSLGAPNLTDQIWFYGSDVKDMQHTIYYSRQGVMPYWSDRLSDDTIRQLTIYVHSLGGGY